jgi:Tol biopolymer transport system component
MKMTPFYIARGHVSRDGPVMSPARRYMYYVQDSTELVMYDRTTGRESRVLGNMPAGRSDLAISVAGDRLAFGRNAEDGSGPFLWTLGLNPTTGLGVGVPKRVSMSKASDPAFSPDGRKIAFGAGEPGGQEKLVIVPAAGGPERLVAATRSDVFPIRWTPDGKTIYFGQTFDSDADHARNGTYRVAASGGVPTLVMRSSDYGAYPGLSPDGRWIISSDPSDDSTIVATADGKRITTFFPDEFEFTGSWLDNTHGLASVDHRPRISQVESLSGGAPRAVSDTILETSHPVWSPDGRMIAAGARRPFGIALANADGTAIRRLRTSHTPHPAYAVTWSPDARSIAYVYN